MHVKIVYGNHWNFGIHVADTMLLLQKVFELAGYTADIERHFCPGYLNVLLEGFDDDFTAGVEKGLKAEGSRLLLVASEFLTGDTFNDFSRIAGDSYYSDRSYWSDRFKNFLRLEAHAVGVWHLGETEVTPYRKLLGHERVHYLPHYWVPGLSRVVHREDDAKDIDFLFTGAETTYRQEILDQLRSKGYCVVNMHALTAAFHREDLLARTKIALNIRQFADWPHPSPSRYFYHLNNTSLLISEACHYQADIQEHILTAPAGNFISYCEEQLGRGDYNARAAEALSAFRQKHPMKERALELISQIELA
jgi:hypothetical protein